MVAEVVILYDWSEYVTMDSIGAARFKEQCLAILEKIPPEGLIITKHGKPVAQLFPYPLESRHLIGCLKGQLEIHGDTLATGVSWDALAEP